jgi:hypothetical protein
MSGTATSEGQLSLSSNGSFLVFGAYRTAPPFTSSVSASASSLVNRAVVTVSSTGVVTIPCVTATGYSANNPRTATSNGTGYWLAGANTGVSYGTSSFNIDTIVSSTVTNVRYISIFANSLFFSTGSGTAGIYRVGIGTPTSSGNVSTAYIPTGTGSSPYAFAFSPDTTVCYIADDRAISSSGGIQKWTRSGSIWTLAYTLGTGTGSTVGARGIAVNWSGTNPVIIASTAETTANRIIAITDNGSTASAATLATAVSNTIYRGVSYTPGTNTIPVSFYSFDGKRIDNLNVLNWSTASEINNNGFEVQKSTDAENFETIGFVKGQGFSNNKVNYTFTDKTPESTSYYRLKQIDFDGSVSYSPVISIVDFSEIRMASLENPFTNQLNINIQSNLVASASLTLISLSGEVVLNKNVTISEGTTSVSLETADIPTGLYILKVVSPSGVEFEKVLKQ